MILPPHRTERAPERFELVFDGLDRHEAVSNNAGSDRDGTPGTLTDVGMQTGLTFSGRARDGVALLALAAAFEVLRPRTIAPRTLPVN
ncbi:hypothetical protein [Microbacterium sp. 1P10AE]|uniref:hypothetical protein n=1 Tax=Microbacterium sp. 1P10AE TaxID=3132286 RepID=UPI0039A25348